MDPSDTATPRRKHVVFLSHAEEDRPWARTVMDDLESSGARCWVWWRDSRAGEIWEEEIVAAIDGASSVVLLMSPAAARSDEVYRELSIAARRGKRLLVFVTGSYDPSWLSRRMEYRLSGLHVSRWSAGCVGTILQADADADGSTATRAIVSAGGRGHVRDGPRKRPWNRELIRLLVAMANVVRLAAVVFLARPLALAGLGTFPPARRRRRDRRSASRLFGQGMRQPRTRRRRRGS